MKTEAVRTEYSTLTDAASALGVCTDTLRAWSRRGRIKAFSLLGRPVFLTADVRALREKRDQGSQAPATRQPTN